MIGPSQLGDVMPDVVLAATETQVAKQREIPRLTTRDDLTPNTSPPPHPAGSPRPDDCPQGMNWLTPSLRPPTGAMPGPKAPRARPPIWSTAPGCWVTVFTAPETVDLCRRYAGGCRASCGIRPRRNQGADAGR